jgi:hypothetical protein
MQTAPAMQALPQPPQLAAEVATSMQEALHLVCPAAHIRRQAPLLQTWPAGHMLPQLPQWSGSELTSTQAAPQLVVPATHMQLPLLQYWVGAQARPHEPQ